MHIKSCTVEEPVQQFKMLMYDSGAQSTVVCDISLLSDVFEKRTCFIGVDQMTQMVATHQGILTLKGQGIHIRIPQALFCSGIEENYVSTSDIASQGYIISHDDRFLWVEDKTSGSKHIIAADPGDKLFRGNPDLIPIGYHEHDKPMVATQRRNQINCVHFRMIANLRTTEQPLEFGPETLTFYHVASGHASLEALRALKKRNIIDFTESKDEIEAIKGCRVCLRANITATPHKKKHVPEKVPHRRIHSDTIGPIIGAGKKMIYITTLTDEATRYMEIITTSNKSFKSSILNTLKIWLNRHPLFPIANFRSDNAVEMPTSEDLAPLGIFKEPICSYSPEQNGLAERVNRTMITYVKKIIDPFANRNYFHLLPLIFKHAVFLINHHETSRKTIPYEAYFNRKVDKDAFRRFGLDVTVKLNNPKEAQSIGVHYNKFSNTVLGTYVGHHGDAGYRILIDPVHILETKDVRFHATTENLDTYFDKIDEMKLEGIHPDSDLWNQMEVSETVHRLIPANSDQVQEENDTDQLALETAPLTDEIIGSYESAAAVVSQQPNMLTEIEVPMERQQKESTMIFLPEMSADQSESKEEFRHPSCDKLATASDKDDPPLGIAANSLMSLETLMAIPNSDVRGLVSNPERSATLHEVFTGEQASSIPHVDNNDYRTSHVQNSPGSDDLIDGSIYEKIDGLLESARRQFRDREVPTPTGTTEGTPLPREDDIKVSGAPYGDVVGSNDLPEDNSGSTQPGASEPVRDEPCHRPNASLMQSLSLGENTNDSRYRTKFGRQVRKPIRYVERTGKDVETTQIRTMAHIRKRDQNPAWRKAEQDEIENFIRLDVFDITPIPKGIPLIPLMFVHTFKADDLKGNVYKARCVVLGCRQKEGIHYNKLRVLSPVVDALSIRILVSIATEFDFPIHHLDIKLAYLNSSLPKGEEIYVKPPLGFETEDGYCWKLKKSVYGMKQSGFEWFTCLANRLSKLGFMQNEKEETIFSKETNYGWLYVGLYVDDLFIVGESVNAIEEFKQNLEKTFDLKYFGPVSEYLGIQIIRTEEGFTMSQKKFLTNLLEEFREDQITAKSWPIRADPESYRSNNNPKIDEFYEIEDPTTTLLGRTAKTKYESGVGSINWAANNTRPDLAFAANSLASRAANPTNKDLQRLFHCLGYISQSLDTTLEYKRSRNPEKKGEFIVETFSDASFAPEADVRLISGMAMYVNRNLVKWLSKKQKNITKSTAASELVALGIVEDRTVHTAEFIRSLGFSVKKVKLYEDNLAVIACCTHKSIHHSRKLVDIAMKAIREKLLAGYYTIEYVPSLQNIADMFTKALGTGAFNTMKRMLLMEEKVEETPEIQTNVYRPESSSMIQDDTHMGV